MKSGALVLAGSLACLTTLSCAGETHERPPSPRAPAAARSEPELPLPDTAFRSGDEDARRPGAAAAAPQAPGRFETRRIGDDDAPRGPRFTGRAVNLDLKNADLQEALRLIADVGNVNIVVSGEVTGTITLRLRGVPWDQALDVIARAKGLATEREGSVILVHARGR